MLEPERDIAQELSLAGCCQIGGVLTQSEIARYQGALEEVLNSSDGGVLRSRGMAYGVRNLLKLWPECVELARCKRITDFLVEMLGQDCGIVRALFFDKPPERSWTLPWHRDRTIAVEAIPETAGNDFSNPTMKAGTPHVTAPNWLLSEMLTLRFSLDPMDEDNGPLAVIPGSHLAVETTDSDLEQSHIGENASECQIRTIQCKAGDCFVMRPLLAHSSLLSRDGTRLRRRVVHIEISPRTELPDRWRWKDFVPVFPSIA